MLKKGRRPQRAGGVVVKKEEVPPKGRRWLLFTKKEVQRKAEGLVKKSDKKNYH